MRAVILIVCLATLARGYPGAFYDFKDVATPCLKANCTIEEDCVCSGSASPISKDDTPQFVTITIDDSVVRVGGYDTYWNTLFSDRANPDGEPIRGTFFVPHQYTDYEVVNILYNAGHEIAVHSVSKNSLEAYWKNATLEQLTAEFGDQKKILAKFANIDAVDIQGVRTPQLQLQGDKSFEAYIAADLSYDSSWPTLPKKPMYPYTLNFKSEQTCTIGKCPQSSFPGVWVLPIVDLNGKDHECNAIANCGQNGTVDEITDWLYGQITNVRSNTRAPITIMMNAIWFGMAEHSFEALQKVLDKLADLDDVFLVSLTDVREWMRNPVPLSDYKTKQLDRSADCAPRTCPVIYETTGETIYMRSCVSCPPLYPWLGNPDGASSKI